MTPVDVQRRFRFFPGDLLRLFLFLGLLFVAIIHLPNRVYDAGHERIILVLAGLGLWRYAWWATHLVRAQLYSRWLFPRIRQRADALWNSGWRPRRMIVMLTTFRERTSTTEGVLRALVRESRATGIPVWVFFGTADRSDETVVERFLEREARDLDFRMIFVRQNVPGKRAAIGLVLRAMSRYGVRADDLVIFQDGDTIAEPDLFQRCLPLFELYPRLDGVTTDEWAELHGPKWMEHWTNMRFAQRHLAMQSHALSGKLLTLTGRLSILRGRDVLTERFIRMVEADYLDHWLWGRYRFLSGDDKSTVYALLTKPGGTMMLYVPDAVCHTVEYVDGNGLDRTRQNLLRWSGNLLRNGRRCIALGPRQVGPFIWWCFVDQQIAMWTTLTGPVAALVTALAHGGWVLVAALLWILATRSLLSLVLFYYNGRVNLYYPLLLYFNQILNAGVKVYILFRLARQRWRNRGDQRSEQGSGWLARYQEVMASYLTLFYLGVFFLGLGFYFGVFKPLNLGLVAGVLRGH